MYKRTEEALNILSDLSFAGSRGDHRDAEPRPGGHRLQVSRLPLLQEPLRDGPQRLPRHLLRVRRRLPRGPHPQPLRRRQQGEERGRRGRRQVSETHPPPPAGEHTTHDPLGQGSIKPMIPCPWAGVQ